jgi:hypothetical protein
MAWAAADFWPGIFCNCPGFITPPLFLCWMLRNAKLAGKPTGSLVGIYIFIASFCFIANFNALYTRFMKTDIYTDELRDINKNFTLLKMMWNLS